MLRGLFATVLSVVLLLPPVVRADEHTDRALATIPADAVAFLTISSLKVLDTDYQQAVNNLGLAMFLPPPSNSIIALMKSSLPLSHGFDEAGSLSIAVMPAATKEELQKSMAILIPATDAKALATAMGGTEGEGGLWTVQPFGSPMYAVPTGKTLVVAQVPEAAKAVAAAEKGIAKRLDRADLELIEGMNVALWIDAPAVFKMFKAEIDGFTGMMMMMQGMGGPAGAKQGEMTKSQIDMLINGARSVGVGLALKSSGLTLRAGLTSHKGSELATRMQLENTSSSLLKGLPADKYLVATGQIVIPSQIKSSLPQMEFLWATIKGNEGVNPETVDSLKAAVEAWLPMMVGARGSVQSLTAGPDGMFGAAGILDTTDSKQWIAHAGKVFQLGKQLVAQSGLANVGDPNKSILDAFTHAAAAETIAGASVDQFKINLAGLGEIPKDDLGTLHKLIGKDGVLLRVAAVNAKQVAISFGGGAPYMSQLVETIKSGEAPLDADTGIAKVAASLPKSRASVLFVAVDNVVSAISEVAALFDEPFPIAMPPVNAPVALCVSGGTGSSRFDLFIPTELINAGKNAAMMAMAAQAMGNGQPPQGAPPQGQPQ